jgi:putative membrane protein insertion efficiency factor
MTTGDHAIVDASKTDTDATARVGPIARLANAIIIALVWVYRGTLGLVMGGHCRFHPSCSQYMIDAVRKYGPVRGVWRGIRRIGRCHPWSSGGIDEA